MKARRNRLAKGSRSIHRDSNHGPSFKYVTLVTGSVLILANIAFFMLLQIPKETENRSVSQSLSPPIQTQHSSEVKFKEASLLIPSSIPVCVYPEKDIVSDTILKANMWEMEIQRLMFYGNPRKLECARCAKPDSQCNCGLFVDIGANIGAHAIAMAALGFRVIAVEPNPNNIAMINCTLRMNPGLQSRITVINALASDEPRMKCDMVSHSELNIGNTQTICGKTESERHSQFLKINHNGKFDFIVKGLVSDKLDNLIKQANNGVFPTDIEVFKIDVETYEPQVLRGAKQLFQMSKVHSLFFECTENWSEFWVPFLKENRMVNVNGRAFTQGRKGCPSHDVMAVRMK